MPKLGDYEWILDVTFFLYPSGSDAALGRKAGGTGFLVALPSTRAPDRFHHVYGVTNRHLAARSPVVRINRHAGLPTIIEIPPEEWHSVPDGYDVAVTSLTQLSPQVHKAAAILTDVFLKEHEAAELQINAGDDVFMVGRFIDYDGIEMNEPSLRFGNISMMRAPLEQDNGCTYPSIIVDMHSRPGYSGSPVFVYRTSGSIFSKPKTIVGGGHVLKLLGVHWGQFREKWDIVEDAGTPSGKYVRGFSGMTMVCPATAITEALGLPALVAQRARVEEDL